ncbi:hypothetical protein NPIL_505861, partial [Nephila pilipes]
IYLYRKTGIPPMRVRNLYLSKKGDGMKRDEFEKGLSKEEVRDSAERGPNASHFLSSSANDVSHVYGTAKPGIALCGISSITK